MVQIARGTIVAKFLMPILLLVSLACFADDTNYKDVSLENTQLKSLSDKQQQQISKAWGVTPKEYASYLYYIKYTPDATAYDSKTTNPLWILAAHTNDKHLYDEYLKKAVEIEYNEVGRMLKVGQDFSVMAHKMHPNEYPIMAPWIITNHLQSGDVVQVFCNVKDQTTSNVLGVVLPRIRNVSGTRLDLFAVGKVSTKDIQSFGVKNQIDTNEVGNKKITLNFGNKAFKLLEDEAHKKLPLPFVVVRRNGKEIPINLGEKK